MRILDEKNVIKADVDHFYVKANSGHLQSFAVIKQLDIFTISPRSTQRA
jgi:hypothetical protein